VRSDVAPAGMRDEDATALYEYWHSVRCRSVEEIDALQALMLRAAALRSLGLAWRELAPMMSVDRGREWWAVVIGGLAQCLSASRVTDAEGSEVVRRLWRAWETAARAEPPVWAATSAKMPRLMRVPAELALDASFQRLSSAAQVLFVSLLSDTSIVGAGAKLRGPHMPKPTTRQLLRRHATSFGIAFVGLTAILLANFASHMPTPDAHVLSAGSIREALLLAVPSTAALTIPMAVLVAVLWEFARLGRDGTLAAARLKRDGILSLVLPVLGAAVGVAALAFVFTAEIVPRTNHRLNAVLTQASTAPGDREMPIGQLWEAKRSVRIGTEPVSLTRAARYEVEVQKKLALPAGCVVLALAAMALTFSVPRGGTGLVLGASLAVFSVYYVMLMTGESLAARLVVSPFVGMWGANALLLAAALLAACRLSAHLGSGDSEVSGVSA
jgi:lipopolysaccharide export LptBFGC system permease protein LptF